MSCQQIWKYWLPVLLGLLMMSGCATQTKTTDKNSPENAAQQGAPYVNNKETLQKIRPGEPCV